MSYGDHGNDPRTNEVGKGLRIWLSLLGLVGDMLSPFTEAIQGWRESPDWIDRRTEKERKRIDDRKLQAAIRGERFVR